MKRWFGGSKSYELSSDQPQSKLTKERQGRSLDSNSGSRDSSVTSTSVQDNGEAPAVAISLKETVVESSRRSHRRQKSSGNWKMLLGDTNLAASESPQESMEELTKDESCTSTEPVRVLVSTKEARPLSFFQKISADESVRQTEVKQRAEIFPWGARQTPSPSADSSVLTDERQVDDGPPSITVEHVGENMPNNNCNKLTTDVTTASDELSTDKDVLRAPSCTEGELISSSSTDSNDLIQDNNFSRTDSDGDALQSADKQTNLSLTRTAGELEKHMKRNSDPCSVQLERQGSKSKRRSFPQTRQDSDPGISSTTTDKTDMDLKCEILKISAVGTEAGADKQTFVLVDPALEKIDGHVKRINLKSFSETVSVDQERDAYILAEATEETLVDTASEESVTTPDVPETLTTTTSLLTAPQSTLRRGMHRSTTELSAMSCRSFDENSVTGSDKGSLHSFRSYMSNKSYSVNDLTELERPSGFGTLDMNRLVGSFQMLDSIISEHAAHTPDDDSVPSLPSSPVSATIQLVGNEDEDSLSVKSLTIIRGSDDDLTVEGRPSHLSLANASAAITINVDSSLKDSSSVSPQSQLSPMSAVISLGGSTEDGHVVVDDVIREEVEAEFCPSQDETDAITPLPSETTKNKIPTMTAVMPAPSMEPFQLPWGAHRTHSERSVSEDRPGALVLRKLFTDFSWLASRKIERVLAEPLEKPLQKSLQRGEDAQLDQLLSTLNAVSEHCLPSLLKTLFAWYERQIPHKSQKSKARGTRDLLAERRDLAVDFLFCLVLIEILKQLNYHPGYDDLIDQIVHLCFSHFRTNDIPVSSPNAQNVNTLADLYAEVLGVLAKSRFMAVKKRFLHEMRELRTKEQNPATTNHIISLIMGLKFFRVKMHPIEEFEACVQFLHDLGSIFIDTKEKEIKHAMAGLFVEIMLPMAAVVQTEVNVPVLRTFVEKIYPVAFELSNKKRNSLALFPMVTCLLCVSQKTFFKTNWPQFLNICINNLKARDLKLSRVALESLYRLVWVYMIRVKCENNATTTQRLTSIVSALFPKGQKFVMPRDTPLNIFVKMLQFIAREKLDFAMREVIFDLLSVGKKAPVSIQPERMSIGLRAFLVISDNLQQKDGEPPMPQTVGVMPSGSTLRVKKTFLNKVLTDESAKDIGIHSYYPLVRKAFSSILRLLDQQVGKSLMTTKPEIKDKDLDDLITVEKKPKLDLLRTCVAAVPRLMPSNDLSISELVEMLLRYTVHVDEELKKHAYKALENTLTNFWQTRDVILSSFVSFIQQDVADVQPMLVDSALRMLHSLMLHCKGAILNPDSGSHMVNTTNVLPGRDRSESVHVLKQAVHKVEGLALVMLCVCRSSTRKMAVSLLKECHNLMQIICPEQSSVITSVDQAIPKVLEVVLPYLPPQEKSQILQAAGSHIDLQWLVDQTSKVWITGYSDESLSRVANHSTNLVPYDAWVHVLSGILSYDFIKARFPIAASNAWPIVFSRLTAIFPLIDPNNAANDQRSSGLLRSNKKLTNERDSYINLWNNYIVFACCVAPSGSPLQITHDDHIGSADGSQSSDSRPPSGLSNVSETSRDLFKILVPLLKCEIVDLRDSCITALGRCAPDALHDLCEEMTPTIRDVVDRKQENVRRRKKKDALRLSVVKLFHLLASNKVFAHRYANVMDSKRQALLPVYAEYIDGMRLLLEGDSERDPPVLQDIRLHYSSFITLLIRNCPAEYKDKLLTTDLRYSLFNLLSALSKSLGHMYTISNTWAHRTETFTELEQAAVEAMCATLSCGKIFDQTGISEADGYIYPWLDRLLSCCDPRVNRIAQETCQNLLRYNADTLYLLDWTIDRCYRGTIQVADSCFTTLVKVFTSREYPCDSIAMLNVALLYCGCPRVAVQEMACQLLHTLCSRFLVVEQTPQLTTQVSSPSLEDVLVTAHCRTQLNISEQLSRLHPELTIQIFSEVCQRVDAAVASIRHNMFSYLSPWLLNIELVNPRIPDCSFLPHSVKESGTLPFTHKNCSTAHEQRKSLLEGEGWGSYQASEMVLNNLVYLTVKYGDEHVDALELLWQELSSAFQSNLRYILKYLLIMGGVSTTKLLPHVKRVMMYLARRHCTQVVDELIIELQIVEMLPFSVESISSPPYIKMTLQTKCSRSAPSADTQTDDEIDGGGSELYQEAELTLTAEEGVVIAKKLSEIAPKSSSSDSPNSVVSQNTAESTKARNEPYPLPMPAYGGYYAPLNIYIGEGPLMINGIQRCFLSLCLLSDIFIDNQVVDWIVHMPTLLQVTVLGCDHNKSLVYDHCKKSLLSLVVCALNRGGQVPSEVMEAITSLHSSIYSCEDNSSTSHITLSPPGVSGASNYLSTPSIHLTQSTLSITSLCTLTPESPDSRLPPDVADKGTEVKDAVECIIELLKNRQGQPLWPYETVTPRQKELKSLTVMSHLIRHLLVLFKQCLPQSLVDQRWCQTSLQFVMRCPSRHYAGRSLQIFKLLGIPMSTHMLSDITSRLVEVVCEAGEEMQGFVTEIMDTIEKSVAVLDVVIIGCDNGKDLFISTPNLKSSERAPSTGMLGIKKGAAASTNAPPARSHKRSTSVSLSNVAKKAGDVNSQPAGKIRPLSDLYHGNKRELAANSVGDNSSAESIRMNINERLSTLVQMFWLGASLLESDYEHEFLLAVNLLKQVLNYLKPDRAECKEKMEKAFQQLGWPKFPGLHSLLVKGLTSSQTCNETWSLLSQLTLCIRTPVISHNENLGFPVNVMCLLPYMVQNYEDPTPTCLEAADNIAQMALDISKRLENLATVMRLYSRGAFGKDAHQWTKCVVKYLTDIYETEHLHVITLLLEVLELGTPATQAAVLLILHCVLHYVDIDSLPGAAMSCDLINTVSKFVEGAHWNEAQKILKLAVKSSSSLIPVSQSGNHAVQTVQGLSSLHMHTSFAEAEVHIKKDLPGRTLDFSFDVSLTPVIGEQHLISTNENNAHRNASAEARRAGAVLSSPSVSSADSSGNWRRPHHSQARVRERLVNLLATLGQRVAVMKSPSVIFSQLSEPVERQMSLCSSSEDTGSITEQGDRNQEDSSVSDQFADQYFDFLDNETEHLDDDHEDKFNWGVKRQHSFNELDIPAEVTNSDVQQRMALRKQVVTQDTESSGAKSNSDELEESSSPVEDTHETESSSDEEVGTVARGSVIAESIASSSSTEADHSDSNHLAVATGLYASPSLNKEELEHSWISCAHQLIGDSSLLEQSPLPLFIGLFVRLFQETKRKLAVLSKEICFYLCKTASLRTISSQLLKTHEALLSQTTCPFIYVDAETAMSVGGSNKLRFAVLGLYEAYTTCMDRKELAEQRLENIKNSVKMQSLGNAQSEMFGDEQKLELCNDLYRLQFQLMSLHFAYMKMADVLAIICQQEEVLNLSEEVSELARSLQEAGNAIKGDDASTPPAIKTGDETQAMVQQKVFDMLTVDHSYSTCIHYMKALRNRWLGDAFGVTITEDIMAVLNLYCQHVSELKKTGLMAVTNTSCDSTLHKQLLELKLQLNLTCSQRTKANTSTSPSSSKSVEVESQSSGAADSDDSAAVTVSAL